MFRKRMVRIGVALLVFALALLLPIRTFEMELGMLLLAYLLAGGDVLWRALKNLIHGRVLDEHFLMSLATIGAFFIGEYAEGAAVMLFYQVGELFQSYAVLQSRKSIAKLMEIRPDYANLLEGEEVRKTDPEEVGLGQRILIRPGERVPLDGVVLEGESTLDTSALTGESLPRTAVVGDEILSGCINLSGLLVVEVTKDYEASTVQKILELVEEAASKKSKSERFITTFARYYTPAVVGVALVLATLPPLLIPGASFKEWLSRALIFLVVSCPCALVISIPLSFFGGIGGASRRGILVKGGNYLEALAKTTHVVFDKTGTLTKGSFALVGIDAVQGSQESLLRWAAYGEGHSNHPLAKAVLKAYGRPLSQERLGPVQEKAGHGIEALVDGQEVLVGSPGWLQEQGVEVAERDANGTIIHVALEKEYLGSMTFADEVKEDAQKAVADLRRMGVKDMSMLTGDREQAASEVAKELGLDRAYARLLPGDKVQRVEELLREKSNGSSLVYVGDGINDAPVLARADVGIAMGGLGSDAAIEAADVVIMNDAPGKIVEAIYIARKTLRIARQNITIALGVKGLVLVLGALGMANLWAAVFADVGVAVIAILNAFRVLFMKEEIQLS